MGETATGTETEVDSEAEEAEETEAEMEAETTETEMIDLLHCKKMVVLVQVPLRERRMAEEYTWKVTVLIPKGGRDYHNICLMEVLWNVVMVILNSCFTASIAFHDVLHGFQEGCGLSTASLEGKLFIQLVAMR